MRAGLFRLFINFQFFVALFICVSLYYMKVVRQYGFGDNIII